MSPFLVRGGVKLSYRKELTSENAIVRMPPPQRVLEGPAPTANRTDVEEGDF